MIFNSYIFIFAILPITLIGYYGINKCNYTLGKVYLLLISIVFYTYSGIYNLIVLLSDVLINYLLYYFVVRKNKAIYIMTLIFNVVLLIFFKLYNISIFQLQLNIYLYMPLAFSFVTFSQLSFIIDSYNNEIEKISFLDYCLYILYFPKLIQGPLVFSNELIKQFNDKNKKRIDYHNLSNGIILFIIGLFKKTIIADTFANALNVANTLEVTDLVNTVLITLFFTIQIYFDFSGYSDMAIGISKMLNIDLPINFNSPYKTLRISDFWNNWHMSLNNFLTKYIYIPLGGNRKGRIRTYVNILIVFLVSGLWHGSTLNFILWGGLNGCFVIIDKAIGDISYKIHKYVLWIINFIEINVGWLLFSNSNIFDALCKIRNILMFKISSIDNRILDCFATTELKFIYNKIPFLNKLDCNYYCLFFYIALSLIIIASSRNSNQFIENRKYNYKRVVFYTFLFVWSVISLSKVSNFIYMGF